jgi:MATE family multidrug resistance protein
MRLALRIGPRRGALSPPAWGSPSAPVRTQAVPFIRVLVWSLPLILLYSVLRRYIQALHYVRPIPFALVTANLVNVFGNWLLIFGHWGLPALGVRGSALSTVFARIYLASVLFIAVKRRDPLAFSTPLR